MAVSYLSRPFKSSPYVLPLDLDLFAKVMTVKQTQFDKNAEAIQQGIDKMGQLDVMKGADRDYLNQKINGMVTNINNNFGGVDFSDRNIMTQIEGLGRDIYGDDKIYSAISSTASVRNLMSTYQKYKTDPKLSKLYSPVNEAYDMSKVSDWMNDGQVGTSYRGPNTAAPYTPYRENHIKLFEKMKADLVETIDDKGLYILKESHERVTPERLMSMAADLLTPDERGQMKKDAWYLYNVQSPTAPETLINKGLQQYYDKVNESKQIWDNYEAQARAAASDPNARDNYMRLAEQAKAQYTSLASQEQQAAQQLVQAYKNDPEELQYQLYSSDYFRGLSNRYSVNRTQRSIQFDQGEMFERKMSENQYQFDEILKRKDRELDIKEMTAELNAATRMMKMVDPTTGQVKMVPIDGLESSNSNLQDPDDLKVTTETIKQANVDLYKQIDGVHQDFIDQIIAERPDLGLTQQTQNGSGVVRILKGQQAVENYNGRPGFQLDDLGSYAKNREGIKKMYGMSDDQINYLTTLYNNYQLMRQGKGASVPDLPKGFADVVEKTTLMKEQITANENKLVGVRQQIAERVNLSPEERMIFNKVLSGEFITARKYAKDNGQWFHRGVQYVDKFFSHIDGLGDDPDMRYVNAKTGNDSKGHTAIHDNDPVDMVMKKVKEQLGDSYENMFDKYLEAIPTRDVFRTKILNSNNPLVKVDNVQKYILDNLGTATPLKGSSKVSADDITSIDNIIPISAGMSADGSGGFYITAQIVTGSGDKKSASSIKIPVDDANAKRLGLQRDPFDAINYSVKLNGRSGDIPVYSNKQLAVTVNVVARNSKSLNDASSFAQAKFYFLDKNGNRTNQYQLVDIPATEGRSPSEAYALAKQAIQQAGKSGVSFEQFKQYLYNYKPSN